MQSIYKRVRILCLLMGVALANPAFAQNRGPSFRVINSAMVPVHEVYSSLASDTSWGEDRLVDDIIPPGDSYIVNLPADGNCRYDVKIVFGDDGPDEDHMDVNTCETRDLVVGAGRASADLTGNPSFNLVNDSGRAIVRVFVSSVNENGWGEDRLGDEVVGTGEVFPISLARGQCRQDLRFVFLHGEAYERRNVDTCAINEFAVGRSMSGNYDPAVAGDSTLQKPNAIGEASSAPGAPDRAQETAR